MGKPPLSIAAHYRLDIIGWITDLVALGAVSNFKNHAIPCGPVFQVMCRAACSEARYHARTELRFAVVGEQSWFTLDDVYELILTRMLMV